ncbi:14012_t:CDS:2, partial [Rhizophagus irregularis]
QLETELMLTPAPAPSTKPSSHIGNCKKTTLRPLLSTKPKEDNLSSDDSDETKDNKRIRKKRKRLQG